MYGQLSIDTALHDSSQYTQTTQTTRSPAGNELRQEAKLSLGYTTVPTASRQTI